MQHFLGNLRSGRDYTGGCRRGSGKAPALRRRLFFKLKLLTGEKFSSGNHTNDISVTLPDRRWTAHINVEYIEPWTSSIAGRQHRRDAGHQQAEGVVALRLCCLLSAHGLELWRLSGMHRDHLPVSAPPFSEDRGVSDQSCWFPKFSR